MQLTDFEPFPRLPWPREPRPQHLKSDQLRKKSQFPESVALPRIVMWVPRHLILIIVCRFIAGSVALRCWICGQDDSPHDTNPYPSRQPGFKIQYPANPLAVNRELRSSWCSTSIANASCATEFRGQQIQCYKELWTVDGKEMIKRGCAKKDARYNRTGCEEQITGAGNFKIVLCMCDDNLCNGGNGRPRMSIALVLALVHSLRVMQ